MNNYYKKKYYKYKEKYLNLIGGSESYTMDTDDDVVMDTDDLNYITATAPSVAAYSKSSSSDEVAAAYGTSFFSDSALDDFNTKSDDIIKNIEQYYNKDNTFIIFTTGMADLGITNFWIKNKYIIHLLNLIPKNFINIIVFHFDPNLDGPTTVNKKALLESYILIKNEPNIIKDPRYKKSIFYNSSFQFIINFIELNHFLIDFAHIFKYDIETGNPLTSNLYKKTQSYNEDLKIPNLNSVYFGYPVEDQVTYNMTYLNSVFMALSKFIIIYPNGNSINYIQKMSEKKIVFDPMAPDVYIPEVIDQKISQILLPSYKKKYEQTRSSDPDYMSFFDKAIREAYDLKKQLIEYYMNSYLMSDDSNEHALIYYIETLGNQYFTKIGKPL